MTHTSEGPVWGLIVWTSKGLVVRAFEDRDLSLVERDLAIT